MRRAVASRIEKPEEEAPVMILPDDLETALKEAHGEWVTARLSITCIV